MDFEFSEDQKMLRTMVRDFAEKEVEPLAAEIDEQARFPAENFPKMVNIGLTGIGFPEKYGGSDGGATELCIATEELCRVCASTGTVLFVTTGLAGKPIYKFSNNDQRERFIPPIAKGEKIACFALTEAGAGSDPASLQTTATKQNGGYLLNGSKMFISNGAEASIALVAATVDKSKRHRGITSFVVEGGTPGFSVGKHENKLGIRGSSTTEIIFEDCFVPEENRLSDEGQGFKIALWAIDASRVSVAAQAVGIAQGAFEKSLSYAKDRQQFGQPIINFQAIQWMLADMATQIDAARLLTYRAANIQDRGIHFIKEASMAKVFAAETAMSITTKAIQIYGGYGYIKDYPLERYFRDAKITEIYEGTSEIQRMTIARQLMREA